MSAAVALPMMVGAGAVSAYKQYQSGQQQGSALDSAAQESYRQANLTGIAGVEAVRQIGKQAAFLRGSQEEAAVGGGVASNTGSPLAVAQEDAREMKFNALKTQFQYDSQAFSLERQGQLQSWSAGKARQTGIANMVTGLLTTGAGAFYYGKGGGFGTADPSTLGTATTGAK